MKSKRQRTPSATRPQMRTDEVALEVPKLEDLAYQAMLALQGLLQYAQVTLTPNTVDGGVHVAVSFAAREACAPVETGVDGIAHAVPIVRAVADNLYLAHDLPADVCFGGQSGTIEHSEARTVETFIPVLREMLVNGSGLKYNPPSRIDVAMRRGGDGESDE